jgi:geranylgeranyl reductase family protein
MTTADGHELVDEAEVVVVGGGPGGASCAARLAELGHDVLVVDQSEFPRDKACGDGLSVMCAEYMDQFLDLGDLLDDSFGITGIRLNFDFKEAMVKKYSPKPRRIWHSYCVTRLDLDVAILEAAKARGARLLTARAEEPVLDGDDLVGVKVRGRGVEGVVAARHLVAADGATSRMRRKLGLGKPQHGLSVYGLRQYFRTENALDPYFDFYGPVEFRNFALVGYAWAFPIEERVANFGIGYFRTDGMREVPPMRDLFDQFLETVRLRLPARFGDFEPIGKQLGSPVGIGFSSARCHVNGIYFVADAARTTDPFTGEGIAYALEGGKLIAERVSRAARNGGGQPADATHALARRFPRLGVNMATIARVGTLALNHDDRPRMSDRRDEAAPAINRVIMKMDPFDPRWMVTAVGRLIERLDGDAAAAFEDINNRALDATETSFPLFREVLARELVRGAGPLPVANVVLTARAAESDLDDDMRSVAVAAAFSAVVASPIVESLGEGELESWRQAILVGLGDYVLSRAWAAMAELPPDALREVTAAGMGASKGVWRREQARFSLERSAALHDQVVDRVAGDLGAMACGLAGRLAGAGDGDVERLRAAGRDIACAHHVATEVRELLDGDETVGEHPGYSVCVGSYGLPVLHAATDPEVAAMVERKPSRDTVAELIDAIRAAGGLERTADRCRELAERAKANLAETDLAGADLLCGLADLAVERAVAGPRRDEQFDSSYAVHAT